MQEKEAVKVIAIPHVFDNQVLYQNYREVS